MTEFPIQALLSDVARWMALHEVRISLDLNDRAYNQMKKLELRVKEARAALAQEQQQQQQQQPAPVAPTDKELLELMPETMKDEFCYAADCCSDLVGGRVEPDVFRTALTSAALEYARAVLERWGGLR